MLWQGLLGTRKYIPSTAQLGERMSKLEETQSEILQTLSRMEKMLHYSLKFTPSHLSAAHTPTCFTNTPPVHPVDYLLDKTVSRTNSLHPTSEVSISPVFEPALTSAQRDPLPLDHLYAK